jgi:cyclophilin family peptidyl-prolyl cis-trans isomerase
MGIEAREGLDNVKGSVGMARKGNDYNSNTSIFYILTESAPTLNGEYTVFGRVVKGMEAVVKMKKGDKIVSAKIRPLEDADRKDFHRALETDAKKQAR